MARPREFDEQLALDQALEAFWSGSFAGTSTQDLCESTGLSRSSLYNTFSGKADIYRQSLERYGALKDEERSGYLQRRGTGRSVLQRLLTDIVTDQYESPDRRGCLVVNAAVEVGLTNADVAALARNNLHEFRALLGQLIARGQDDGSITSTTSADDLAAVVHATLNGLQVAGRVAIDRRDSARAVRTLMSLL
ncbi:TetR/AcrR family transcriptional regulator [Luteipulveratus mongoliensis]|uniref:Transcriptional regulator n=1 Tax=Luteipulveratus mongoliensis TaxID=571913 RepID=A0A0K1JPG5_9MICO|nr:TetR family transcriptional regulator [Luteipulveratus mongoliensis]AKU18612.1 hypothetical protein VV02_03625 [Luteipulveratus mongoliensis]